MASSCVLPSSPTTPRATREDSVTPTEFKQSPSPSNMLKIQALLNPAAPRSAGQYGTASSESLPSTPSSVQAAPASFVPRQDTLNTSTSSKRQKHAKGTPVCGRGTPKDQIIYSPFELTEEARCLSQNDREELARQHKIFQVQPARNEKKEALVSDATRFIPYSSDKRSFLAKTGQDGFQVFEYTFRIPGDEANTQYTVIWDYVSGLTRITPFFKACKYKKTTPAKALQTNKGLKELAHSITGGALAAQGYWIPYACARALCLTFAYKIRWALTPIFGPSFIRECLPPNHPKFGSFRIDTETVRCAELEAEGWRPSQMGNNGTNEIPRSVPQDTPTIGTKDLRPRVTRPTFKLGSPFDSDVDDCLESSYASRATSPFDSPDISPKTPASYAIARPGWTSINRGRDTASPTNTGAITPLTNSLLTQPRYASWRPADPTEVDKSPPIAVKIPTAPQEKHRLVAKRRRSSTKCTDPDADYKDGHSNSDVGSASSSESDDVDIIVSPEITKKRARHEAKDVGVADYATPMSSAVSSQGKPKSKKFTTADYRAAMQLINLCNGDAESAAGPGKAVGGKGKRKASSA